MQGTEHDIVFFPALGRASDCPRKHLSAPTHLCCSRTLCLVCVVCSIESACSAIGFQMYTLCFHCGMGLGSVQLVFVTGNSALISLDVSYLLPHVFDVAACIVLFPPAVVSRLPAPAIEFQLCTLRFHREVSLGLVQLICITNDSSLGFPRCLIHAPPYL